MTFEAPGFGTQTCQSTVTYWQGQYGQVFDASWSCEGKPSEVQTTVLGIASYGCCDGSETISDVALRYSESACAGVTISPATTLTGLLGLISASAVANALV